MAARGATHDNFLTHKDVVFACSDSCLAVTVASARLPQVTPFPSPQHPQSRNRRHKKGLFIKCSSFPVKEMVSTSLLSYWTFITKVSSLLVISILDQCLCSRCTTLCRPRHVDCGSQCFSLNSQVELDFPSPGHVQCLREHWNAHLVVLMRFLDYVTGKTCLWSKMWKSSTPPATDCNLSITT